MSDITMCKDIKCPLKDKCYRFTAFVNPYRQSYFLDMKYSIDGAGTDDCEMFWNNDKKTIIN